MNIKLSLFISLSIFILTQTALAQCPIPDSEGCGGGGYQWNFTATPGQTINDLFIVNPAGACIMVENLPGNYTLTCFDPDPATSDPIYPLCVLLPPCDLTTTVTIEGIGECVGLLGAYDCIGDNCESQPGGCGIPCVNINLNILFDAFPNQTNWEIVNDVTNLVEASGGPYTTTASNTTTTETLCLESGCYTLNFFDSLNNGMCPFQSAAIGVGTFITPGTLIAPGSIVGTLSLIATPGLCGNFSIIDDNGNNLASGGGAFGTSQSVQFCL